MQQVTLTLKLSKCNSRGEGLHQPSVLRALMMPKLWPGPEANRALPMLHDIIWQLSVTIPMEISIPLPSPIVMLTLPVYSKRNGPNAPQTLSPFLLILNPGSSSNSIDSLFSDTTDDDMSQDSILPLMVAFWQGIADQQDANCVEPLMRAQALKEMLTNIVK